MHRADVLALAAGLLPAEAASALTAGAVELRRRDEAVRTLLASRALPPVGWRDEAIEAFVASLAALDGNNTSGGVGGGEREGRVFSALVRARHWGLAHGVGRSGDLTAAQPKAAGSSVLYRLTNALALQAVRSCGITRAEAALVVPCATGLTMSLMLRALVSAAPRDQAPPRYAVWCRIDQKSCFKALLLAGLEPVVISPVAVGDELRTDVAGVRAALERLPAGAVAAVVTTTSCFAPRAPDDVVAVARLCAEFNVPHVVNHAYGLQLSGACHALNEACRVGRVDAFVSSTDKNFLVPVGGAIVAAPGTAAAVHALARAYPGRASASPIVDLLVTLLSMGTDGLRSLLDARKSVARALRERLAAFAARHGERVLDSPANSISFAMTVGKITGGSGSSNSGGGVAAGVAAGARGATYLGSMLFARSVSGARVVHPAAVASIDGHAFFCYGAHTDGCTEPYITLAAAIGMTLADVEALMSRLDRTVDEYLRQRARRAGAPAGGGGAGGASADAAEDLAAAADAEAVASAWQEEGAGETSEDLAYEEPLAA